MKRSLVAAFLLTAAMTAALAASGKEPPPAGAFAGAPPQFTRFSSAEIQRGFMVLAFGSDLRLGVPQIGIHRFERPIRVLMVGGGNIERTAAMQRIVGEYGDKVPNLRIIAAADVATADVEVRLIEEKKFRVVLAATFGAAIAKRFIAKVDPQCMTHIESNADGDITHSISFVIVDKGDRVFLDCAYHELLHAFGLSNHDQRNPWTTLNQKRMVGYLSVYDRALLTVLYSPRLKPGMTAAQARAVLPGIIKDLGLAAPDTKR
jgi:hypothetical protein